MGDVFYATQLNSPGAAANFPSPIKWGRVREGELLTPVSLLPHPSLPPQRGGRGG